MKKEITNCGLIALSNVIDIKKISMRTLINTAKDNGVKLFPYEIDLNEVLKVKLPAIFHSKNHFVFASEIEDLINFELTGYILHTEKQPYETIPSNQLKTIIGCSWVAVGVAGVSVVSGIIASSKAKKEKKRIAREIANQKRPELQNIAEGLQVSTRGTDLQREEVSRNSATSLDSLADAGTRALGVGVGRVAQANADSNSQIGANLDEQQKNIDMIRAQDNGAIRGIKEQRSAADLAALSSQYNAANQAQQDANANIIQGLGTAGNAYANRDKTGKVRKEVKSVNSITPSGTVPLKVNNQITAPSMLSDPYYNQYKNK